MSAPAPRVYRCQVSVEQKHSGLYVVASVPYPLHRAEVKAQVIDGRVVRWAAVMLTGPYPRYLGRWRLEVALANAGEQVGLLAGLDMKERFHGIQRTAMGQGKCPHLGKVLCLRSASPGSVWCELHPDGRKVVNDVPSG